MSKPDEEKTRKLAEYLWGIHEQTLRDYFAVSDYYREQELNNNQKLDSSTLTLNNVRQAQNAYLTALELEMVRLNGREWLEERTYASVKLSNDIPF